MEQQAGSEEQIRSEDHTLTYRGRKSAKVLRPRIPLGMVCGLQWQVRPKAGPTTVNQVSSHAFAHTAIVCHLGKCPTGLFDHAAMPVHTFNRFAAKRLWGPRADDTGASSCIPVCGSLCDVYA